MAASKKNTFHDCVEEILESWTVLRLAVEHGFGGVDSREKAKWMVEAVDDWFKQNSNLEEYEVEDFLTDILSNEFDTVADDGSLPQISTSICRCYSFVQSGKWTEIETLLSKLPKPNLEKCVKNDPDEGDSDSSDEPTMETDMSDSTTSQAQSHTINTQSQGEPAASLTNGGFTQDKKMEEEEDDGWTMVRKGKKR